MNTIMAENFIRSAKAPAIKAGVMIAKVIWNIMYTVSGMVYTEALSVPAPRVNGLSQLTSMPLSSTREKSPMYGLPLVNARL